jgi:serine/threonine protein kinase
MEIMRGGELFDEVMSDGGFTEDKARGYFRDILFAMCYCHGKEVCHRDLKLENLLLTDDKRSCKVADFGLAKNVTAESARTVIGTAKYVSPEVLSGAEYDGFKADIWSCGVCLYCMVECRFPFDEPGNGGVGEHGQHRATRQNLRLMKQLMHAQYDLKRDYSPEFVDFLSRLLTTDVNARYTAAEALVDPWMLDRTWTKKKVLGKIHAMDTRSAPIPGDYTSRREWVAKVEELCGASTSSEDEDDGF